MLSCLGFVSRDYTFHASFLSAQPRPCGQHAPWLAGTAAAIAVPPSCCPVYMECLYERLFSRAAAAVSARVCAFAARRSCSIRVPLGVANVMDGQLAAPELFSRLSWSLFYGLFSVAAAAACTQAGGQSCAWTLAADAHEAHTTTATRVRRAALPPRRLRRCIGAGRRAVSLGRCPGRSRCAVFSPSPFPFASNNQCRQTRRETASLSFQSSDLPAACRDRRLLYRRVAESRCCDARIYYASRVAFTARYLRWECMSSLRMRARLGSFI